jgi:hypothetical protein
MAVRAPPIKLGLVIDTVTPGNAPPLLSVARPVMLPVAACAKTFTGSANAIIATAKPSTLLLIQFIDTFTFLQFLAAEDLLWDGSRAEFTVFAL